MLAFDPYSPAIDADPFPYYQRLRDEAPCFWSAEAQMWVLSRYADIVSAGQDWQTYSSASGNLMTELPGRAGATLGQACGEGRPGTKPDGQALSDTATT